MDYCPICNRPKYITGDLSYFEICRGHPETNSQITINGQTEEIRLLREILSKLNKLIELLGKI